MAAKLAFDIVRLDRWPVCDQQAWQAALHDGGIFGERGRLAHHTEQRLQYFRSAYGRWLGFLDAQGKIYVSGLDDCDDQTTISAFMDQMSALAPITVRGYLTDLYTVCSSMMPDRQFPLLHAAMRYFWRTARPITNKQHRLVPARDLYQLGVDLMADAPARATPLQQASQYRDGLMIALLIACPVRLANFRDIEIGRNLLFEGSRYRLRFDAHEVKNKRWLGQMVPTALNAAIDAWIKDYRPICLAKRGRWWRQDGGDALWITSDGDRYRRSNAVRDRIERATASRFGHPINPHLFRDIAATAIASEIPQDVAIIRDVLGHTNLRTGEQFYNQASTMQAAGLFQTMLDQFRVMPAVTGQS